MIFDPALAAAARRHARAQAKSHRSSASASPAGVANPAENSNTATSSSNDGTPAGKAPATQEANLGGSAAGGAHHESSEHGSTAGRAAAARGERAGSTSSSVGDGAAGSAGALTRTASSSTNGGGELEGAIRVGPVVSRSRAMKPRMLLKIVVLGCSNVRLCGGGMVCVVCYSILIDTKNTLFCMCMCANMAAICIIEDLLIQLNWSQVCAWHMAVG